MRGVQNEMLFYVVLFILALVLAVIFAGRYLFKIDFLKLVPI